jgi:hypothetical protein
MVKTAMKIAPFVNGYMLIMANPSRAQSTSAVIDNATSQSLVHVKEM